MHFSYLFNFICVFCANKYEQTNFKCRKEFESVNCKRQNYDIKLKLKMIKGLADSSYYLKCIEFQIPGLFKAEGDSRLNRGSLFDPLERNFTAGDFLVDYFQFSTFYLTVNNIHIAAT